MSIREESSSHKAREKQEAQIAERHLIEEEARPAVEHRALIFILRQISLNNRDAKPEADFFIAELDKKGADQEKLEQLETLHKLGADAGEGPAPTSQTAPPNQAPMKDTAELLRTSKRFKKNKAD